MSPPINLSARQEWGGKFRGWGAKFAIFALTYNVQFWSYEHVVNMFLVSFDLKKHLGTLSERSEHLKQIFSSAEAVSWR